MLHTVVESFQIFKKPVEIFGLTCLSLTFCLPINTINKLSFRSLIVAIAVCFNNACCLHI